MNAEQLCSSFIAHRSSFPQRRFLLLAIHEIRDSYAGQPIQAAGCEVEAGEESESDARQIVAARGRLVGCEAAGGGVELARAELHRDGPSDETALRERGPKRMRLAADVVGHFVEGDVALERVFAG